MAGRRQRARPRALPAAISTPGQRWLLQLALLCSRNTAACPFLGRAPRDSCKTRTSQRAEVSPKCEQDVPQVQRDRKKVRVTFKKREINTSTHRIARYLLRIPNEYLIQRIFQNADLALNLKHGFNCKAVL